MQQPWPWPPVRLRSPSVETPATQRARQPALRVDVTLSWRPVHFSGNGVFAQVYEVADISRHISVLGERIPNAIWEGRMMVSQCDERPHMAGRAYAVPIRRRYMGRKLFARAQYR